MAQMKEFLNEIKVGAKQNHKNMTLYCLLSAHEAPVNFLTLDNALGTDALSVLRSLRAVLSRNSKSTTSQTHKILLLDGEELVGAKQNRVLNTTILIAPKSETIIPVSCVEQGRWSYRSKHFGSRSRSMSANLRKRQSETVTMNLREGRDFRSNQGVVGTKSRRNMTEWPPALPRQWLWRTFTSLIKTLRKLIFVHSVRCSIRSG